MMKQENLKLNFNKKIIDMNFNELEKTLNDYDNNITKDVFTHAPAIVVLQMKVQDYKRARNRLDKFESPDGLYR